MVEDGSVVCSLLSCKTYIALAGGRTVQRASRNISVTASNMAVEIMTVARRLRWRESQDYTHECVPSGSFERFKRCRQVCYEWLESVQRSTVRSIIFIFVPGHASVPGTERADRLTHLAAIYEGQPPGSRGHHYRPRGYWNSKGLWRKCVDIANEAA